MIFDVPRDHARAWQSTVLSDRFLADHHRLTRASFIGSFDAPRQTLLDPLPRRVEARENRVVGPVQPWPKPVYRYHSPGPISLRSLMSSPHWQPSDIP